MHKHTSTTETEVSLVKGFQSLSPELILEIASHILSWGDFRSSRRDLSFFASKAPSFTAEQADLANLRLACRYLSRILERDIFRSLTFDFHVTQSYGFEVESRLVSLTQGVSLTSRHATFLDIKCLNPIQERGISGRQFSPQRDHFDPEKERAISLALDTYLTKAILSLQNLRCVVMDVEQIEDRTIQVVGSLSELPLLEDVTLQLGTLCRDPIRLGLHRFHGLRSLCISFINHPRYRRSWTENSDDDEPGEICRHISKVIQQSPMLQHLGLLEPSQSRHNISLHNLLKSAPAEQPFLYLESLHFALPDLVLNDPTVLRHLKGIKVLRIDGSAHPLCTGTDIWGPLTSEQIELQEITVSHLSKPLLAYLASYSGLKKLRILLNYYPTGDYTRCDTSSFFNEILLLHGLSSTVTPQPGNDTEAYSLLRGKNGLIFEVDTPEQIHTPKAPLWWIKIGIDCIPDALPLALEAVTQAPEIRIERLHINYSSTRMYFGCGSGSVWHRRSKTLAGQKWLSELVVTNPSRYPSIISLSNKEFILEPISSNPELYKYQVINL